MVNVATSAETGPTVPKDTAATDRRTVVVRAMSDVGNRETARIVPAARGAAPDSGVIATTVAVTIAEAMPAEATTAVVARAETTTAENVAETTAGSSQAEVTIVAAPVADLAAAASRAVSARPAAARPSARSAATLAPTNRTSPMRSRRANSIRRSAVTC